MCSALQARLEHNALQASLMQVLLFFVSGPRTLHNLYLYQLYPEVIKRTAALLAPPHHHNAQLMCDLFFYFIIYFVLRHKDTPSPICVL